MPIATVWPLYRAWQAWMREHKPPMLVVWAKYDPSFAVGGATAYQRVVPSAEVHILNAGHFVLDEKVDEIPALIRTFSREEIIGKRTRTRLNLCRDLRPGSLTHGPN